MAPFSSSRVLAVAQLDQQRMRLRCQLELLNFLRDRKYADKKIIVLSIAGQFRTGKSFLLNLILRHLNWLQKSGAGTGDWLLDPPNGPPVDEQQQGFHWRHGTQRDTTGILVWAQPFLIRHPLTAEEVVVLLMDTQGLCDNRTNSAGDQQIFTFSTLMSSTQIFNVPQQITAIDIQMLAYFAKFAEAVFFSGTDGRQKFDKQFQDLCVLIRDWRFPDNFNFGSTGGKQWLHKFLEDPNISDELVAQRKAIESAFQRMNCFLLPYPGDKVVRNTFDGRIADIDPEFLEHTRHLVRNLWTTAGPLQLRPKNINGQEVTCSQWLTAIEVYSMAFGQGTNLPEPMTLMQAQAEATHRIAVMAAFDHYACEMAKCLIPGHPIGDSLLDQFHIRNAQEAMDHFQKAPKLISNPEMLGRFRTELTAQICQKIEQIRGDNAKMRETKKANEKLNSEKEKEKRSEERAKERKERADKASKSADDFASDFEDKRAEGKQRAQEAEEERKKWNEKEEEEKRKYEEQQRNFASERARQQAQRDEMERNRRPAAEATDFETFSRFTAVGASAGAPAGPLGAAAGAAVGALFGIANLLSKRDR